MSDDTMQQAQSKQAILDTIPDPDDVRNRLAECQREAAVLRRLLRVATSVKESRRLTEEAKDDARSRTV